MKIKPLHDRVVVKRLDELTKTSGGIIIPDTAKEKPSEGIVEAVGDVLVPKTERLFRCASRSATRFCLPNGAAPRSS